MSGPTERLYYLDSYLATFTARVLEAREAGNHTEVVLDRTAFYPEGGGQPADTGALGGARVEGVVEKDGRVVHQVRGPVPSGEVAGEVDWERRFDHMQQHTGQHVLSQAFERLLGAQTVSFHMGRAAATIDLGISELSQEQVIQVEELCSRVVGESRPVKVHMLAPSDLARFELRKGTDRLDRIRVIEVEGFDAIPCGGTHVRSTSEVGLIKVVRWDRRGANTRVEFLCGDRALADYRAKNRAVLSLAATLHVRDSEVEDAVGKLLDEGSEMRQQVGRLRNQVLDFQAGELRAGASSVGKYEVVSAVLEDRSPDDLKHLAARLVESPSVVALLAVAGEKAHLVFARSDDVDVDAAALFRTASSPFGGRGGGRANLAQGGLPDPSHVPAVLDAALKQLRSA